MNKIVIVEQHEEYGVDWIVSFDGHNPMPDKCVTLKSKEDAFKLKLLIEEFQS